MIKAWALRLPSSNAMLAAAGAAPPLAIVLYELVGKGQGVLPLERLAGLGLAFVALEAALRWLGIGQFLVSRILLLFCSVTLKAAVAGLGLAGLALFVLPLRVTGIAGGIVVGLCTAGVALGVRSLWLHTRDTAPGLGREVLILGREDLVAEFSQALVARTPMEGAAPAATGRPAAHPTTELSVDPLELERLVRREGISRIVVVEPDHEAREKINSALLECRLLGVSVEDAVEVYQRLHGKLWLKALDPERLVYSDGFRFTASYRFLKRLIDVVVAAGILIFLAPLMALIALAIKLESPGPFLFRQRRVGQFGRVFTIYKFRSMRADAEKESGPAWARPGDARVTRVGAILRKFHLDEIPQAFNVLRGDLSFVGPRPERPCFVEVLRNAIPFYHLRHYVKPGVTGWAQVRCPYAASVEDSYEKLEYDLYYARNMSLGLDLRILAWTALVSVLGNGR